MLPFMGFKRPMNLQAFLSVSMLWTWVLIPTPRMADLRVVLRFGDSIAAPSPVCSGASVGFFHQCSCSIRRPILFVAETDAEIYRRRLPRLSFRPYRSVQIATAVYCFMCGSSCLVPCGALVLVMLCPSYYAGSGTVLNTSV